MTKKSRDLSEHPTFIHTPSAWINVSILCVWIPISRGSLSKGAYGIKSEVDGPRGWKWTIASQMNHIQWLSSFGPSIFIQNCCPVYMQITVQFLSLFCLAIWFQDRPLSQTDQFHVPRTVHLDPWSSNFSLDTLAIWPKIELTIPIENELGGWVTLIKIVIIVRANN